MSNDKKTKLVTVVFDIEYTSAYLSDTATFDKVIEWAMDGACSTMEDYNFSVTYEIKNP